VGPDGEQLTEVDGSNAWKHTNVYAGGKLIGTYDTAGLHFYIDDPLGARRAQVSATGTLEATYQSLPFGDGVNSIPYVNGVTDPTENHFTGKERDTESGNDYFDARYYNSATGRFLSPDWDANSDDPVPYAKLDDPQSLSLYAYVGNNPVGRADPDGRSYLVYDDNTHTITLYNSKGDEIGHWDAHNNVAIHNDTGGYTNGPAQDGTYNVRSADASGKGWGHAGEESYGTNGIAHFDGMVGATGNTMDGAGVHSGRKDDTAHVTFGCVRTTDAATTQIKTTAKDDALTTLQVKDNQSNVDAWKKSKAGAVKAAAAAKAKKKKEDTQTEQQ
jgi:RHS repeat-associated protein